MAHLFPARQRGQAAIWYRIRADLRRRRLQAISVILVVALSTLLVELAFVAIASVSAPFDRLFNDLHGAHLRFYLSASPTKMELDTISRTPNVQAMSEGEEATSAAVLVGANKLPAYLQSFPVHEPTIGQLLLTHGTGLAENDPDGVILDQPFADAFHLHVGNQLTLITPQGRIQMHVRGTAFDVNHNSSSDGNVARVHFLRTTLEQLFPGKLRVVIGLRLVNPYAIQQTASAIAQRLQAQGATYSFYDGDNWLSYRESFGSFAQLGATLLMVFGIFGIIVAGIIVVNLITGQVLAQRRDLGILKAIGFIPHQLILLLVLEYLLLGTLGTFIGLAGAAFSAPPLLAAVGASLDVPVPPHYDVGTALLLLAGVLLLIGLFAALPTWRASRIEVVNAIRPEVATQQRAHTRRFGLALPSRFPPVLNLGLLGIIARPLRMFLVLLTLLVGVMTTVFGLGLVATIQKYVANPGLQGIYADVSISPDLYDPTATARLIASQPKIASYYTTYYQSALIHSQTRTLNILFTTGNTQRIAANISAGRWYRAQSDEIVMTAFALHTFNLQLGDRLPLTFSLANKQQISKSYTVVGVLSVATSATLAYAPQSSFTPFVTQPTLLSATTYEVTLRPAVNVETFAQLLLTLTKDRISVRVNSATPPDTVYQLGVVMAGLSIVLMFIAGVSMLNAMTLSTRERRQELGILKAIGFTPGQVLLSVTLGASMLGLLSAMLGIPLGLWATSTGLAAIGQSFGAVGIIAGINWLGVALVLPSTLIVAMLGAYFPARRAAYLSASEIIRYE